MKNSTLFFFLFFSLSIVNAQYYTFSNEQQLYQSISNPDLTISDSSYINNNGAMIHSSYSNFKAFGESVPGTIEVGRNGYIVALGDVSDFVFDPFLTGLRSDGNSQIQAREIKIGADSVFEVEWKEMRIENHPDSNFITFTARIYITSEIIEFHFGPSQISTSNPSWTSGPYTTILHTEKGFMVNKEEMWVTGNPNNPTISSSLGALNGFPANGTMYRFAGKDVAIGLEQYKEAIKLDLYPNPAFSFVTINAEQPIDYISVHDISGRNVGFERVTANELKLPIQQYESGIYWVNVTFMNGNQTQTKFIKY